VTASAYFADPKPGKSARASILKSDTHLNKPVARMMGIIQRYSGRVSFNPTGLLLCRRERQLYDNCRRSGVGWQRGRSIRFDHKRLEHYAIRQVSEERASTPRV
jgi:hypothetical protein